MARQQKRTADRSSARARPDRVTGCALLGTRGVSRAPGVRPSGRSRRRLVGGSEAGDVGGQEVDAVSVEVAAGSVVVFGGAGVGVPGQDLGVA
jgi:hypothetical protein